MGYDHNNQYLFQFQCSFLGMEKISNLGILAKLPHLGLVFQNFFSHENKDREENFPKTNLGMRMEIILLTLRSCPFKFYINIL